MRAALLITLLASISTHAAGPTEADLRKDATTVGDITTYGGGYDLQRYSPLKEINRSLSLIHI